MTKHVTEPMNDDLAIRRLRSALDEVVDGALDEVVDNDAPLRATRPGPTRPGPTRPGPTRLGPTRLASTPPVGSMPSVRTVVLAAAIVLIAVGTGWIVMTRGEQSHRASPLATTNDTTSATTNATTSDTTDSAAPVSILTTTVPAQVPSQDWFSIRLPGLVPGVVGHEKCCPSGEAPGPASVTAWAAKSGYDNGLLLLLAEPTGSGPDVRKFMSYGLSDARTNELKSEVVAGSGLPYVLPDPKMELVGFGLDGFGARTVQSYVSSAGNATISVGDYRGQLTPIVLGAGLHPIQVAGSTAYRYTDFNGIHVVWRIHTGNWAQLDIDQGLADRELAIIGAVVPAKL